VTGQSNLNTEPLYQELQASDALGDMKFPEPSVVLHALHRLRIHRLVWLYGVAAKGMGNFCRSGCQRLSWTTEPESSSECRISRGTTSVGVIAACA
jgi:hypothetical protein